MIFRSSWIPGRIPFTLITLPLFWLILSVSPNLNEWRSLWVLFIVHGLLYASVNGYINFYDHQPKNNGVTIFINPSGIWHTIAMILHAVAVILGFVFVNIPFGFLVLTYGIITYAAGLTGVLSGSRLIPWIIIRVTQGLLASFIYYIGLNDFPVEHVLQWKVIIPGIVSSLVLAAFFPYVFKNADKPVLKRLFYQNIALLLIAAALVTWFFSRYVSPEYISGILIAFGIGVLLLFEKQYTSIHGKENPAPYLLWVHWIATLALNGYAFYIFTDYTQIFQLVY
jgi:hypothetical protein